jgi:DNA-binding CsgD family transcriptional regulator
VDEVFIGLEPELAAFAEVVARVGQGQPWLVCIEGESGVGKTALATRAVGAAAGWKVLWAHGDPSESDLAYGLVGQLLRGVDREVMGRFPLLRQELSASSPFAVGAELLGVVGEQQADGPVVMILDDVQWADGRSVEALSFVFRRLSVDPVLVVAIVRGDRERLDERTRRMLLSIAHRQHVRLSGLRFEDLAPLASAVGSSRLDSASARRLFELTGGHTLYVRTVLGDPDSVARLSSKQAVSASLASAIGDQVAVLPADTRAMLEMLAVLNARVPLARLSEAAGVASASQAVEPAVEAGLVDWWPHEPTCPVMIRHDLQREALYGGISPHRRRDLHVRAVSVVDEGAAWVHRVAALDRPDEDVAGQLEQLATKEAGAGQTGLACTHLLWASDISPARLDRERRLLTAVLDLTLLGDARGFELRGAAEAAAPSPLRSSVLGAIGLASGRLSEAELRFSEALAEVRQDPEGRLLAARIAVRLAGTYVLLGEGNKVKSLGRWALDTGCLGPASKARTHALVALGEWQTSGPVAALAELAYLDADPRRIEPVHVDAVTSRGIFHFLAGDLTPAVTDLAASLKMARDGATVTFGLRGYGYLALAHYFSGAWDDALLICAQGLSAATIHGRPYDLALLHLAATCVPAGRGSSEEAEGHARSAQLAVEGLDYGHERLYADMARALVCQTMGDYSGIADALGRWPEDEILGGRSKSSAVIWQPLLIEGLIGSDRHQEAEAVLGRLSSRAGPRSYLQPALAWLEGWLSEAQGRPQAARRIYQEGEAGDSTHSPLYRARLLLAHGRLLRRTGQHRPATERLREAHNLFRAFGAGPFVVRTEAELVACGLHQRSVGRRDVLEMTTRESEVAHLINQRMTNAEIAAELFITPKAVEYHLGNIYAKFGLKGRQQLRRYLDETRKPAPV